MRVDESYARNLKRTELKVSHVGNASLKVRDGSLPDSDLIGWGRGKPDGECGSPGE